MQEIVTEKVQVTTTGDDDLASGSQDSGVLSGFLLDIFLDYHASAPAGTDVTVAYENRGGNLLSVGNNATDALYAPRQKPVDNANSAITNAHVPFPLNGKLTVSVAQSDALDPAVTAYIRYLRI